MRILIIFILITTCHFTRSHSAKRGHAHHDKQKRAVVERTTVLILGGGMAGVEAANTLKAAGMTDFLLLEGADHIGGRARSANWLHGVGNNNNPLVPLARASKLYLADTDYYDNNNCTARDSNGKFVTESVKTAMSALKNAEKRMFDMAGQLGMDGNSVVQVGSYGQKIDCSQKEGLDAFGGWVARTPAEITAEHFYIDYVESKPPNKVSLLGNLKNTQDEVFGKKDNFIPDSEGFLKPIRYLAAQVFAGIEFRLRMNEIVTEVHYALENDGQVPADLPKYGVYVKTAEGKEYWARYCIITFSNAVMLSGNVKFQPALPDWKVHALDLCETAVYNKIFVTFGDDVRPFWDKTQWILYVDSNTANDIASNYNRGYYSIWQNLNIEGILPDSNMMMGFVVDDMAKAIELKSDAELKSDIMAVLRRMYGNNVPEPKSISTTKWYTNPLTLGSFHVMRPGLTSADVDNLARDIGNLYFAGDGADASFHGNLHAAYFTAEKKARVVLQKITAKQ
jgi:polyamine oxidase